MQGFADFADSLLRGSILLALSLALGGVGWGLVVLRAPGAPPERAAAARRCVSVIVLGAILLVVVQAAFLGISAAVLLADLGAGRSPALLATLPFRAGIVRAVLGLVLAGAALLLLGAPTVRGRWRLATLAALAVAGSGAWLVHGAARLEGRALLMTCTTLHQVAAAVWTGGLVQLGLAWRLARRDAALARDWPQLVTRFSQLALGCVIALVASSSPLVWTYVGSVAGLIGTGYGSILATKVALFGAALVLAVVNRRAVRRARTSGAEGSLRTTLPALVEGETLLAVLILFTAATLASQPPATDVVDERATWEEVVHVFAPKRPTLRTPSIAAMEADTSDPLAVVGGERTPEAYSWSNFSHNVAGLLLLGMSLLAIAGSAWRGGWGRHWPLGFIGLGVFVFLRTSANDMIWPFGPRSVWTTMWEDAEVLQHRLGALLVVILGLVEWRARSHPTPRLPYVFPLLAGAGGLLLLTHSHAAFEPKPYYLIQVTHTTMGGLAVLVACARWLELRLPAPGSRVAGAVSNVAMLLIALILVFYQEANVTVPDV
jgi:putative copper resistance protein D